MVFVVTADQRRSRSSPDRVDAVLGLLNARSPLRPFERTAGDEVQGVLATAADALEAVLALARQRAWSVGLGVGSVREPLPDSTRAGAGPAFEHARAAVERAKARPDHVALGASGPAAADADALLALHAALVAGRSDAGWEAVDLVTSGRTQNEAATELGVSKQAVSQRLRAAWWPHQRDTTGLLLRLLEDLDDGGVHGRARHATSSGSGTFGTGSTSTISRVAPQERP